MAGSIVLILLMATGLASVAVLGEVTNRWKQGLPLVPYQPRQPVPWNGGDVALVLCVFLALSVIAGSLIGPTTPEGDAEDTLPVVASTGVVASSPTPRLVQILLADSAIKILTVVFGVALVVWRAGATMKDLGFRRDRLAGDLKLGVLGFLAVFAPIYLVQLLLTWFLPSKHPIVELLAEYRGLNVLLPALLAAVIVAPLAEEFFFRLLLQGWLEAVEDGWLKRHSAPEAAAFPPFPEDAVGPTEDAPPLEAQTEAPEIAFPAESASRSVGGFRRGTLPILGSAVPFALMHVGHGPDPIPLLLLAIVLGYLYQRTHRIVPCIVVHLCLNSWSMAMLWAALRAESAPG